LATWDPVLLQEQIRGDKILNILGVNAYHGDSSAALLQNGQLTAAIEEERLVRVKHWAGLPLLSIRECIRDCGAEAVDHIAISRNPRALLWRKLVRAALRPTQWGRASQRGANSLRIAGIGGDLRASGLEISRARIHFIEHHRAHLASAFFCSPFDRAAVVSIDGFGDFSSVMWGVGTGNRMKILGSVSFPHSLGIFYTAFTQFLGFPNYGDEYKMMGLAAYGEPTFLSQVRDVVATNEGQCRLNLDYFTHHSHGVDMTWNGGSPVVGSIFSNKMRVFGPPRVPRSDIEQKHADLAASVQAVLEENYFSLLNHVHRQTGEDNLCLAGGVALNCAANGKVYERSPFRQLFIQPAANDAGTSIGAALYTQHQVLGQPRSFVMNHVYYGTEYSDLEICQELRAAGVTYRQCTEDELLKECAQALADGKILGWFQGRMEFGPRALGNRSILADPRSIVMKDILNSRIKYREPFRPFCPSILKEATADYFEISADAPFMVTAYKIQLHQRDRIPAVTHADGTGRLQTVERACNPLYWKLLKRFCDLTQVPVLINTSFNENEPVVRTPSEALDCFMRTEMDVLVLGPYFVSKSQNSHLAENRRAFATV
jgi:carbamoyltransferase